MKTIFLPRKRPKPGLDQYWQGGRRCYIPTLYIVGRDVVDRLLLDRPNLLPLHRPAYASHLLKTTCIEQLLYALSDPEFSRLFLPGIAPIAYIRGCSNLAKRRYLTQNIGVISRQIRAWRFSPASLGRVGSNVGAYLSKAVLCGFRGSRCVLGQWRLVIAGHCAKLDALEFYRYRAPSMEPGGRITLQDPRLR